MGRLEGRAALVSGGAAGIGAATCRRLAREGAKVVVADVQAGAGEAVANEIRAAGGQAVFERLDVRREENWIEAIQAAEAAFGKLRVLVNNAGIGVPTGVVETLSLEDWRAMNAVNSDGVFLGVKHAVQAMRRAGEPGSIVNISSIVGIVGLPGNPAYVAAKGAVRLLTKSAALYCAREGVPIRVNSVHPGYIRTDIIARTINDPVAYEERLKQVATEIPVGALGEPEDIADGVLFLASDESRYMTGAELVIDGGYTAR